AGRRRDRHAVHPFRRVARHLLLPNPARHVDPVGEALHRQRVVAQIRQDDRRHGAVVRDQIAFGVAVGRKQNFALVRQRDASLADDDAAARGARARSLLRRTAPLGVDLVGGALRARCAHASGSACCSRSRTTVAGSLSLRSAMNTGWRRMPSRVHSANATSPTSFGETQWAGVFGFGGFANGEVLRSSGFSSAISSRSRFASYPVPTWPAYTNLPASW